MFVTGSREGLMQVGGRKHNSDDLIATALAVEPMKVVYRARIVIFSVRVLRDERIIIVAEQRPDIAEDECFQWMSRVLQAVDSIHQVGVYCLALCPANTLPKVNPIISKFVHFNFVVLHRVIREPFMFKKHVDDFSKEIFIHARTFNHSFREMKFQ